MSSVNYIFDSQANRTFPSRIVMYRDGVGDGQLGVVRDFEVPQFYKLFTSIRSDYKPKLTYNVVQKRINTRIFAKEVFNYFLCDKDITFDFIVILILIIVWFTSAISLRILLLVL